MLILLLIMCGSFKFINTVILFSYLPSFIEEVDFGNCFVSLSLQCAVCDNSMSIMLFRKFLLGTEQGRDIKLSVLMFDIPIFLLLCFPFSIFVLSLSSFSTDIPQTVDEWVREGIEENTHHPSIPKKSNSLPF